ncbi:MAG: ABC transporter ATP-binding protein [bacterium]
MTEPVITVEDVCKNFNSVQALKSISLQVQPGEIFGLIGPDGAGKTTLIRIMTTVMSPAKGKVNILGWDSDKQAQKIKDNIGYMSQQFGLYNDLTVLENLKFYADVYQLSSDQWQQRLPHLLDFSGLAEFIKRKAGNLSGGMKQKLGLICTLIHTPKILFLDEPTNGVDPLSRREFWKILYTLTSQGLTIVVSTAYLEEAERCTKIGLIHRGELLAWGSSQHIKQMIPQKVIEIRCSDNRKAMELLKQHYHSHSVSFFGDCIHVSTEDAENLRVQLKIFLENNKINKIITEIHPPQLEDVLLSLIE